LVGSIGGARWGDSEIPKEHLKLDDENLLNRINLICDFIEKE